jgi:dephospho-CoA kinase
MTPCHDPGELCTPSRWKHGASPVIGLIGAIGSGKSQVARLLADRGAVVIDADAIGHELLDDPAAQSQIVERFGTGVLVETDAHSLEKPPRVDRSALGAIVFADPTQRRALESILHPRMRAHFEAAIQRAMRRGTARSVVLDAAILLEAGWDDLCDLVVFVDAPRFERMQRVARARGWSEETFAAREHAQWSCDEKLRRSDWVIRNDAAPDHLDQELDRLDAWLRDALSQDALISPHQLGAPADRPTGPVRTRWS